jgi:uridine kinase
MRTSTPFSGDDELQKAAEALEKWRGATGTVTVVAIDGHGASGKSTIAAHLCAVSGASVVHTDDFFLPDLEAPTGGGGRGLESYYELARLRTEALGPLRAGQAARYHAFDWDSGRLSPARTQVAPSSIVIVEGDCAAAPGLSDLVDRAIYVDTPEAERLRRLRERVVPEDWDSDWLRAEQDYFARVRPVESFDLVIRGSRTAPTVLREARAPGEGRRAGNLSTKSGEK